MTIAKTLQEQIHSINSKKSNPWQAPPVTHYDTVFTKKEKTIPEI